MPLKNISGQLLHAGMFHGIRLTVQIRSQRKQKLLNIIEEGMEYQKYIDG